MISRVAEHCFWMSRYLERAEDTARILDVNRTLLLDYVVPVDQQWRPLLIICGIYNMPGTPDEENVQQYMTWDLNNPSSILSSLEAARENARIIREVISAEMWEQLNYYHHWLQGPAARALYSTSRSDFYGQIRRINQLLHGIADSTMAHGEPWEFFQLGRMLERASQTSRILDVKYHMLLPRSDQAGTPVDNAQWVAILTSCSGYEPFHKKVRPPMDTGIAVADFLIFEPKFPRSVRFCLAQCQKAAHDISSRSIIDDSNPVNEEIDELTDWIDSINIRDVINLGLHEVLTRVVDTIHDIGNTIHSTYFDVRFPRIPNPRKQAQSSSNS